MLGGRPVCAGDMSNTNSVIETYCASQTPDDYETQRLCVKRNLEGLASVKSLGAHYAEGSVERQIIERSITKWFPRYDWAVERARQQIAAFEAIGSTEGGDSSRHEHCTNQWPNDYVMQHYCLQAAPRRTAD